MPLVGMDTTFATISLQTLVLDHSLGVPSSIFLTQLGLALTKELYQLCLQRRMRQTDLRLLHESRWFELAIKQDLSRDRQEHLVHYYKASRLVSSLISLYP